MFRIMILLQAYQCVATSFQIWNYRAFMKFGGVNSEIGIVPFFSYVVRKVNIKQTRIQLSYYDTIGNLHLGFGNFNYWICPVQWVFCGTMQYCSCSKRSKQKMNIIRSWVSTRKRHGKLHFRTHTVVAAVVAVIYSTRLNLRTNLFCTLIRSITVAMFLRISLLNKAFWQVNLNSVCKLFSGEIQRKKWKFENKKKCRLQEEFYPFYVFTAVRKFFFFLDPKKTGKIYIRDLLPSTILPELYE